MIQSLDTVIAHATVVAARGTPDAAGLTVFHRDVHRRDFGRSQLDHNPVVRRGTYR